MRPSVRAIPWPEGEALFRSDPRWVGGDDAYSIVLDDERRLWLFGDSFVADEPGGDRRDATFVNNTVAVQEGPDTTSATGKGHDPHRHIGDSSMRFAWGSDGGTPAAFFPRVSEEVYRWPGHGAVVDGTLIVFFMLVRDRVGPIPPDAIETLSFFEVVGWDALTTDDLAGDPRSWNFRSVRLPRTSFATLVGNGGVFVDGDHLYAHAWHRRRTFLARWELESVRGGDLGSPRWWSGTSRGWEPGAAERPAVVMEDVETEFTVHRDESTGQFVHVQLAGLGEPRLEIRRATRPQGPWSEPVVAFRPRPQPESFAYAGKAHPGLSPDGLAVTYNTIAYTLDGIRERPDLYVPRAVVVVEQG